MNGLGTVLLKKITQNHVSRGKSYTKVEEIHIIKADRGFGKDTELTPYEERSRGLENLTLR
jgi:hypothetical protein